MRLIATLLATLFATIAAAAVPAQYGVRAVGYPCGAGAFGSAVGDFDDDGLDDLAVGKLGYGDDAILFSQGDGSMVQQIVDPAGYWRRVASGDLNQDGHLDLVVANVRVYLGHGDGTFDPPVTYPPAYTSDGWLTIADVDGNGHLDVVTGPEVYPGNGDGTLGPSIRPEALLAELGAAVDLDGDLDLDLVGIRQLTTPTAIVYRNDGPWSFAVVDSFPIAYPPGEDPGIEIADVDGDLVPDFVWAGEYRPGAGDCTFGAPIVFGAGDGFAPGVVADLDDDGVVDLVDFRLTPGSTVQFVRVYRGLGSGAFAAPVVVEASGSTTSLAAGDFDGDGHLDLAATNFVGIVMFMFGNGDGTFGESYDTYGMPGSTHDVAIGDAIGDDAPDILACIDNVPTLRILPGAGDGTFGAAVDLPLLGEGIAASVSDLNADGEGDVIVVCPSVLSVFYGTGGGVLGSRVDHPGPAFATSLGVGDLNGDAQPDVAVTHPPTTYLTQPDGSLGPPTIYANPQDTYGATIAEVTGDAYPDVVVTTLYRVETRPGSATGTLDPAILSSHSSSAHGAFTLANVTGSPALDAVHASGLGIKVMPGEGNGAFGAQIFTPQRYIRSIAATEFTGDANPDLLTANDGWLGFVVFAGSGSGTFEIGAIHGTGGYANDADLGDLDGDGRAEVVVAVRSPVPYVSIHFPLPRGLASVASAVDRGGLALAVVANPVRGAPAASFTLATAEPAAIELVDLAGRRMHREDVAAPAPGERRLRLALPAPLSPGVYWMRLVQGERRAAVKVAVVN